MYLTVVRMATCTIVHVQYIYECSLTDDQLALAPLPSEQDLRSSLYLFSKPETYSLGVRPPSLIVLIIDPAAESSSEPVSIGGSGVCDNRTRAKMRYEERDCAVAIHNKRRQILTF